MNAFAFRACVAASAVALAGICAPAAAQLGNPAGWAPTTMADPPGKPAPNRTNVQDELFVQLASAGDRFEIQASELALQKSGNDGIKDFAQRMKQAHSDTSAKLASIAQAANVPVSKSTPPDDQATLERLKSLDGDGFDSAYLQAQLVAHQKAAQLLIWEAGQGQNGDLQRYAAAALVDVLAHMEAIQRLLAEHTTVGKQGLATR
ncbi:MAG TPA: DUF4142 domain-containing protein [Burkholderiaceae bacterium]|nr:DUF4142 domain-containing protein [Burkholderiaceae bacterium]